MTRTKRGGNYGGGRPPKALNDRAIWGGKIRIGISPAHALKLQSLMLRPLDGVSTPEQLMEYLIDHADLVLPPQ